MRIGLLLLGMWVLKVAVAQDTDFPIYHPVYQLADLEEIRSDQSFYSAIKPYDRKAVYGLLQTPPGSFLSRELRKYTGDTTQSKRPLFKNLYRYPADLFYYQSEDLTLHVNPALQFSLGSTNDAAGWTYINSRGLEIRGAIDRKISFYTYLTENQAQFPTYVNTLRDSTLAQPFEGFWKQYNETGVDFLRAQGYIDFGLSKSISAQLGYGKHFVGDGYRSLVLSDFSNNYPYLRLDTKTRLFSYTNVFAELIGDVQGNAQGTFGSSPFNKKYLAFHHLTLRIKPNFHLGLFESVIYGDSTRGLKLEYMNPIIFYRAVEQQNGSADNVFIGMDFKWHIKNRVSLYGQLLIDEMIVSEVFAGNGWWGNKQGVQLGLKYADAFGVKDLLLQGEYNRVRPYTYAHQNGYTSYSHYNQALAHPLGANFTEVLGRARYRIHEKWNIEATALWAIYGNDLNGENYGRDLLKNYTVRRSNGAGGNLDFGNDHLQGDRVTLAMGFARVSFMVWHQMFIDAEITHRRELSSLGSVDTRNTLFNLSFRCNISPRDYLF